MNSESQKKENYYGKRPLWQWILLYVVIGAISYGIIYYFFIAKKRGYAATKQNYESTQGNSSSPSVSPETGTSAVSIKNFTFTPATLSIKRGTTVTWTNEDITPHDIQSDTFKSQILNKGESFRFTFNKAGTFTYICSIHPSMRAKIIVE